MKKILVTAALSLGLVIPGLAWAASGGVDNNVTLAKGDNRTGTYYAAGQTVTIDGDVDGDVVCAGQTVVVNGAVKGDVLCAGQQVTVNGAVSGSVRAAGQIVTVNGSVGRNITAGGQSFVLGSGAHVAGEVAVGGQTVAINGPVDRDVFAGTSSLLVGSTIGGDLNYMSNQTFSIDQTKVKGSIVHQAPPSRSTHQQTISDRLGKLLFWILSGLVVTMAAVWLTPKLVRGVTDTMIKRPGASFGWGALTLVAGPIVLFALAITVIGLPLSFLVGGLWIAGLLSASLFAGVAVGLLALGRKETDQKHLALAGLAGVPLVLIVGWLPWLGLAVGLGAAAWAMGALVLSLNKARS